MTLVRSGRRARRLHLQRIRRQRRPQHREWVHRRRTRRSCGSRRPRTRRQADRVRQRPERQQRAYDKHVYMTNDGRLRFGVYNGASTRLLPGGTERRQLAPRRRRRRMRAACACTSTTTWSVRTPSRPTRLYQGYWRVGGDNLNAWPDRPSPTTSPAPRRGGHLRRRPHRHQVDDHYRASGRSGGADTVAPTTAITSPADGATMSERARSTSPPLLLMLSASRNVDLEVDGTVVASDNTDTPTASRGTPQAGTHTLVAVARDAAGNVGRSADVDVTVDAPDTTPPAPPACRPRMSARPRSISPGRRPPTIAVLLDTAWFATAPYSSRP